MHIYIYNICIYICNIFNVFSMTTRWRKVQQFIHLFIVHMWIPVTRRLSSRNKFFFIFFLIFCFWTIFLFFISETCDEEVVELAEAEHSQYACRAFCVSICTFVPVKQVNWWEHLPSGGVIAVGTFSNQFTCFTGTKVQILTQKARQAYRELPGWRDRSR
jgi:hypothetical protein